MSLSYRIDWFSWLTRSDCTKTSIRRALHFLDLLIRKVVWCRSCKRKMATFFRLLSQRNQPVEAIFAATDTAEENRLIEANAAIRIQSVARMRRAFLRYMYVRRCIVDMQRVYRGYRGRVRFLSKKIEEHEERQRQIIAHFAVIVQSRFRGYYSRKWISDFYAQKCYLMQVHAKAEQVRKMADEEQARQLTERNETLKTSTFEEYQNAMSNMHHLLSTAARSGVLRPGLAQKGLTTVFSSNIEEDIRKIPIPRRKFKPEIPPSTIGMGATKGGSRIPPLATSGPSLHSQSPYDAVQEQERLEKRVNRKLMESLHQTEFVTRKPEAPKPPKTIGSESQYVDQYSMRSRR